MSTILYTRGITLETQEMTRALDSANVPYIKVNVGEDMLYEDFLATYPQNTKLPFIVMDGTKINGYRELVEHLLNRPTTLYG